ncbi:MAG: GNAT family N-acetyltransferase [Thermoplasmata archaeon]
MAIEVVALDSNLEEKFWEHVNQDPLEYFFIYDMKLFRKITEVFLAMEDDKTKGMMVVFRKSIVQLRGNRKAVEALLDHLDLKKLELVAPKECKDIVLNKIKPQKEYEMVVMHLKKGQEKTLKRHEPVRLAREDSEEIASIMRESYPDWWGDTTGEQIERSIRRFLWLGLKREDRLVSIGNVHFLDIGSNIGVVATDKAYRNKGYATSIVSASVEEIFAKYDKALIHVLDTNQPAIHVYEKIGFKSHSSYLMIKKGK